MFANQPVKVTVAAEPIRDAAPNAEHLPVPPVQDDFYRHSRLQDIGRWHINDWVREVARSLPPGTRMLDAGAGECVYKPLFAHCEYTSVDMAIGTQAWNYTQLDSVASLDRLPMRNGTFDAVLCTQTLEHLEWPREAVAEMHRVLKPGGALYLSAPMAHCEHQQPYDFFRYTSFGLRSILTHAGFTKDNITIIPFGGLFTRLAYELPRTQMIFPPSGARGGDFHWRGALLLPVRLLGLLYVRLSQRVFLYLDRFDTSKNDPFGWSLIARKSDVGTTIQRDAPRSS